MARWLESHWGLPPWLIILIIAPVLVTLLAFLLRRMVLRAVFYVEKGPRPRKIWSRLSLYLAIILTLLCLFLIWESRVEYLAEDLSSVTGRNMADLLPYLIGIRRAFMATLILVFLIFNEEVATFLN